MAQPSKNKTSGSTFKNPVRQTKKKAWELIKESVPLDTKFGGASISTKHCNFFVNEITAKFDDMNNLINFVKDKVKKRTGIDLELEIVRVILLMTKRILILAGGLSKKREIRLKTAKAVSKVLNNNKYKIKIVEPDGNFILNLKKFKPSVVFNALHGRYGEDGYIQTILEKEKVKYTHSGVISASLAIDKVLSKKLFTKHNILTRKAIVFNLKNKIKKNKFIKRINRRITYTAVRTQKNERYSDGDLIRNQKK